MDPTKLFIDWAKNLQMDNVTYIESSKFPTTPGLSPGVGLRKQGLLALQMIPCTQGSVPAEGMALFGKWPGHVNIQVRFFYLV